MLTPSQDNIIRVGDLVAVVRGTPCCNSPVGIGIVFEVKNILSLRGDVVCKLCSHVHNKESFGLVAVETETTADYVGFPIWSLQKIRPPSQETTRYTALINKVRDPLMIKNLL